MARISNGLAPRLISNIRLASNPNPDEEADEIQKNSNMFNRERGGLKFLHMNRKNANGILFAFALQDFSRGLCI